MTCDQRLLVSRYHHADTRLKAVLMRGPPLALRTGVELDAQPRRGVNA
jgi:hypothetical protein